MKIVREVDGEAREVSSQANFNPEKGSFKYNNFLQEQTLLSNNIIYETKTKDLEEFQRTKRFQINFELDAVSIILFVLALCTRFYKLEEPRYIV